MEDGIILIIDVCLYIPSYLLVAISLLSNVPHHHPQPDFLVSSPQKNALMSLIMILPV
jgi:hypothetical protein